MNIEIANRLVQMRKEKGYSQEALAHQLGISRQAVSKWERAESSPDTSNLITLAKLYNISLDELLNTDQDRFESAEPLINENLKTEVNEDDKIINVSELKRKAKGLDNGLHRFHIDKNLNIDIKTIKSSSKGDGLIFFIITSVYLLLGTFYGLWHPGWIVFLTYPILSSFLKAVKNKDIRNFSFPVLVVFIYLYIGLVYGILHPTWIIFITIPLYSELLNLFVPVKPDEEDLEEEK